MDILIEEIFNMDLNTNSSKNNIKVLNELRIKINTTFKFFNDIFKPILELEDSDKIGIIYDISYSNSKDLLIDIQEINFSLYLDKYTLAQFIRRWWYTQNRTKIFFTLDKLFNEYKLFLQQVTSEHKKNNRFFSACMIQVYKLNNTLIKKLNILKYTYQDSINIVEKIDKYIEFLVIFDN